MRANQAETSGESDWNARTVNDVRALEESPPNDALRTPAVEAVGALSDTELLAGTRRLVCQSNRVLAALLAHLAEVEARGLHRTRACASLFTYCIYELRMSEDAAFRRVAAARLVKRFPQLFGAVERGELHLTALLLLGPHLTETNVTEVVARAQFRTKKEVAKLVRLLSPLPDVPSRIEPLGLDRPRLRPTWGNLLAARHPVRDLPSAQRPANWLPPSDDVTELAVTAEDHMSPSAGAPSTAASADACAPLDRTSVPAEGPSTAVEADSRVPLDRTTTLSGPQRYSVQFTASEEYVALVEEAKALLAHALPSVTLAELHLRALRTLVTELKKRKFAVGARRVEPSPAPNSADATMLAGTAPPNADAVTPHIAPADDPTHPSKSDTSSSSNQPTMDFPRQRGRTVPAAVRRAVFERDGHRCAYVDARGVRCRETRRLELHHRAPFARGGPATLENLSLYCAAHNTLAAEQDFGRTAVLEKREQHRHFTERNLAAIGVPER